MDDLEQLRVLSIFHYVVAGITAIFALFPVFHVVIGIAMITGSFGQSSQQDPMEPLMGWFFLAFSVAWILAGLALAVSLVLAGRWLAQRRHYLFCLVVAALACIMMPFGTILGVFTIIVLMRPSVKTLFSQVTTPETLRP